MAVDHAAEVHVEDAAPPRRGLQVEAWIFIALTGFFFLATVLYAIFAGSTEPVGVVALALTTGLSLIIGTFLLFSSRRLEQARPEDNENAHVSDVPVIWASSRPARTGRSGWRWRRPSPPLRPPSCWSG